MRVCSRLAVVFDVTVFEGDISCRRSARRGDRERVQVGPDDLEVLSGPPAVGAAVGN